jgi:aspartate/methionine/tyrosine aminotransferase
VGFGKLGEGFVRISLIADALKLEEAARRIGTMLASYSVS